MAEIDAELEARRAARKVIDAGAANRKALQDDADRTSGFRAAIDRLYFERCAAIANAERVRLSAIRTADPIPPQRRAVQAALRAAGYVREMTSDSGSSYYAKESGFYTSGYHRIRVSNHEVPETDARIEASMRGGFSWANGCNIILDEKKSVDDLLAEVREILDEDEEREWDETKTG